MSRMWFKPSQMSQSVTSWRFTEPEYMSEERWKFEGSVDIPERLLLLGVDEDAAGLDPSGQKCWSLILGLPDHAARVPPFGYPWNRTRLLLLLLRELGDGTGYKRVDCTLCSHPGRFVNQGPIDASIGRLRLARKEFKLRLTMHNSSINYRIKGGESACSLRGVRSQT